MSKLDYGTLIGYAPVPFEVDGHECGHIKKPLLSEVDAIGFRMFEIYESSLKLSPKELMASMLPDGKHEFDVMQKASKQKIELYDLVLSVPAMAQHYLNVMQFFFVEPLVFACGQYLILKQPIDATAKVIKKENVLGVISRDNFQHALYLMQCVCCIEGKEEADEVVKPVFKSKLAEELYHKMYGEDGNEESIKKPAHRNKNLTLANIVSVVANYHNSLNYTTIYNLTIPQLYDAFQRLQQHEGYDLHKRQVSIWGDEKNQFDPSTWYHNIYDA